MEYRPLEVTVISAKDVKDTNLIGKQNPYAVVWLGNDTKSKQKTPIHKNGGTNPTWNHTVRFNVEESAARNSGLVLHVLLRCDKPFGDKDVGEVAVPVKELLDAAVDSKSAQFVCYQVRTSSGKPRGVLNLSYKFGDRVAAQPYQAPPAAQPACCGKPGVPPPPATKASSVPYAVPYAAPAGAYPPPPATGYPYMPPPPPCGTCPPGAPYPPTPGHMYGCPHLSYGCPPGLLRPQQGKKNKFGHGYGYPHPPGLPPQQGKKNKSGLGLGAGLLGGAIGGLLLGDMIGDAAEASYDAGFDDGFGFEF